MTNQMLSLCRYYDVLQLLQPEIQTFSRFLLFPLYAYP